MNWDDLRIFLAVTREGSLSAAARNLKVTQPTVGRRLKALEEGLGTGLFDRLPDGMVLTTAGAELLPLAESMELSALAVDRRQASFPGETRGTVRLSIWESFAPFLTDHLPSLQQSLPEVEIELGVTHTDADLSRREADLLIRECLPNNPSLIARKLAKYTFAVYGGADFVAHNPAALGEARYSDCSWVGACESIIEGGWRRARPKSYNRQRHKRPRLAKNAIVGMCGLSTAISSKPSKLSPGSVIINSRSWFPARSKKINYW